MRSIAVFSSIVLLDVNKTDVSIHPFSRLFLTCKLYRGDTSPSLSTFIICLMTWKVELLFVHWRYKCSPLRKSLIVLSLWTINILQIYTISPIMSLQLCNCCHCIFLLYRKSFYNDWVSKSHNKNTAVHLFTQGLHVFRALLQFERYVKTCMIWAQLPLL